MLMPAKTISAGGLLVVIGLVVGFLSDATSVTKWIAAIIGAILLVLGLAAQANDGLRHHLMHGAAAVALLAILATVGRLASAGFGSGLTTASQLALIVICAGYLFTAVQSFRAAAAARRAGSA